VLKESTFDWKELDGGDGSKSASASNAVVPIRIDLESDAITFRVADRPAFSYLTADTATAPSGTNIAVRASGFALRTKELRAISTHRDDYTFNEAPTDWYSPQGTWSVISRWPCYSDWSFFGGKGVNPVLWSKRSYSGDIVVEMYAHNQMDLPKEVGYSHPGDLNITIGGDGKNPASGYSFIVAGWDNTRTRILKGTQSVAENTTEDARFPRPINHNMQFHRRWYYIRAEVRRAAKDGKPGVKVSLTVDDTLLCEYFDPTPIEAFQQGGHVAFWTVDGTIMIARAKIESASMGSRTIPTGLLDAAVQAPMPKATTGDLAPRPIVADGLPSAVVERAEGGNEGTWTLRNPTAGGLFEVQLIKPGDNATEPWKVTPNTKLDFDVALPENVKVDLYATIDGMLHMVSLTNNQRPDARVRILGTAKKEASAQGWQHVTFDLGAALKKMYPEADSWKVDQLSLGALHGDEYRWVGFDGNPLGATYRLKGMKLTGATQIASAPVENGQAPH